MLEATAKIDKKGRIIIPKKIRESVQLTKDSNLCIRSEGKTIILEVSEPIADKYYGIVPIKNWPDDIDKYLVTEVLKQWKRHHDTM